MVPISSRDLSWPNIANSGPILLYGLLLWLGLSLSPLQAKADRPFIEDLAAGLAALSPLEWTGPRVDHPEESLRPDSSGSLRSEYLPISIHWDGRKHRAIRGSRKRLASRRRGLSFIGQPSNGRAWCPTVGGEATEIWIFYLKHGPGYVVQVASDSPILWSFLDRASTFGTLTIGSDHKDLAPCISLALFETMLLAMEPAESHGFRRATSRWLNSYLHQTNACQLHTDTENEELAESSADSLQMLGGRKFFECIHGALDNDPDSTLMLWQGARQRTWEGTRLRAEPSLWSVLKVLLEAHEISVENLIANCAKNAAVRQITSQSASSEADPKKGDSAGLSSGRKTLRLKASGAPLQGYETRTRVLEIPKNLQEKELRIWLRGEFGVKWVLQATQLSSTGIVLSNVRTPSRRKPHAYLPTQITKEAQKILIQVTNFPDKYPPPQHGGFLRSYHLVVAHKQ